MVSFGVELDCFLVCCQVHCWLCQGLFVLTLHIGGLKERHRCELQAHGRRCRDTSMKYKGVEVCCMGSSGYSDKRG